MPIQAAKFDPTNPTASGSVNTTATTFNVGLTGNVRMVVWNASSSDLQLTWGSGNGQQDIVPAWQARLFCITIGNPNIGWSIDSTLSTTGTPPASLVKVYTYSPGENIPDTFPIPIQHQVIINGGPVTTAGNVFSCSVGWGSTTDNRQKLNVFNPPNSGVDMIFHSARVFDTNAATNPPTANLCVISGADLNLANPVTIYSHTGSANPPVSVGHATTEDTGIAPIPGNIIEVLDIQANVTMDFLTFPDTVTLAPGNNLLIDLAQLPSGYTVRLTMKWSELPSTVPTQVINLSTQSAANIVNDGNASGTGIIEATPSGQSSSAIHLTNDGVALFNILISGVYHQWLKTQTSGNPLQLGQLGDVTEILGTLVADNGLNTNTVRDNVVGNPALDLSAGDGSVAFPKAIKPNIASVVLNGSTSGTATLWQFFQGTFKLVVLKLDNFRNGSAPAQTLALPTPFTTAYFFYVGNVSPFTSLSSGVAQNVGIVTTLNAAGGSATVQTTTNKYSFGDNTNPCDTINFLGGQAGTYSGFALFIGI